MDAEDYDAAHRCAGELTARWPARFAGYLMLAQIAARDDGDVETVREALDRAGEVATAIGEHSALIRAVQDDEEIQDVLASASDG